MLDVLLIDDEATIRLAVGDALRDAGHRVTLAGDGTQGLALASSRVFDAIVTDIRLPRVDGMTIFRRVHAESPDTEVILITAYGEVGAAVEAMKEGAFDYLTKPFDNDALLLRLQRIEEKLSLRRQLAAAREAAGAHKDTSRIIGRSPQIVRMIERISTIAPSRAPILVTGESGTGKELVAQTLHALSDRNQGPFVAVNCAALPETLLEAELFGHERGAFTGAVKKRDGRFKAAHGGTLFLDEVAEIPPSAQAKLLRVLEEGTIEPLGSNEAVPIDVRIISATHRDLKQRIADKLFREDLYFRLNVIDLHIPALRERRSDLPLLIEHFLRKCSSDGVIPSISPRAFGALSEYAFPGNVRELQHAMERASVLARGKEIDLDHLPPDIAGVRIEEAPPAVNNIRPLSVAAKEFEREYLLRTLELAHGKKAQAAGLLGITRKNLWEKLRAHGVTKNEHD